MNARQASEVVLVHAVESVDEKGELLSYEERRLANGALEGEGAGSPLEAEVARAAALVPHLQRRAPWLLRTTQQFSSFSWRFTLLFALGSAFFGASVQVLDGGRTFHVLSKPLLGLILWNTISLCILLLGPLWLRRKQGADKGPEGSEVESSWGQTALTWLLAMRRKWLDWRKPEGGGLEQKIATKAMREYWEHWPLHASKLLRAQCMRLLHLGTIAFCCSALFVAYSRGLTKAYRATKESTFLGTNIDLFLGVALLPSQWLLGPLPQTKATTAGLLGPAAPWIHHYAVTLLLLVMLPRLALFAWATLQSQWYTLRLPLSMEALSQVPTLNLALSSHTNVGKTSLARTLLRRDVGEVRDAEHVTRDRAGYFLLNTPKARLRLWDTPGFGDARALTHNLREKKGWAWLRALQDPELRYDREAALSLQDEADLILYLVPAKGNAEVERTLREEWEVLREVGCPVLCLLNRLEGASAAEEEKLLAHWQRFFAAEPLCREVLALDAFSRSWEDERGLFEAIERAVAPARKPLARELREIWEHQHEQRHLAACGALAHLLQELSLDSERDTGKESGKRLQKRAQASIAKAQGELLETMGLASDIRDSLIAESEAFLRSVIPDRGEGRIGAIVGGALSGLVSGIMADVMAGGLTFFGGAAIGMIGGALGGAALGEGYRRVGGRGARTLVWQEDFLQGVALRLTLLYLAAASFGRARGAFTDEAMVTSRDGAEKEGVSAQSRHQARLFAAAEAALKIHWPYLWPLLAVSHDPKADKLWAKMLPGAPTWVKASGAVAGLQPPTSESEGSDGASNAPGATDDPLDVGCTALFGEALAQWSVLRKRDESSH